MREGEGQRDLLSGILYPRCMGCLSPHTQNTRQPAEHAHTNPNPQTPSPDDGTERICLGWTKVHQRAKKKGGGVTGSTSMGKGGRRMRAMTGGGGGGAGGVGGGRGDQGDNKRARRGSRSGNGTPGGYWARPQFQHVPRAVIISVESCQRTRRVLTVEETQTIATLIDPTTILVLAGHDEQKSVLERAGDTTKLIISENDEKKALRERPLQGESSGTKQAVFALQQR